MVRAQAAAESEADHNQEQHSASQARLSAAAADAAALTTTVAALRRDLAAARAEASAAAAERDQADGDAGGLRDVVAALEARAQGREEEVERLEGAVTDLEQRLADSETAASAEAGALQAEVVSLKREQETAQVRQNDAASLRCRCARSWSSQHPHSVTPHSAARCDRQAHMLTQRGWLQGREAQLEGALADTQSRLNAAAAAAEAIDDELAGALQRVDTLEAELADCQARGDALHRALAAARAAACRERGAAEAAAFAAALRAENEVLTGQLAEARQCVDELQAAAASLQGRTSPTRRVRRDAARVDGQTRHAFAALLNTLTRCMMLCRRARNRSPRAQAASA